MLREDLTLEAALAPTLARLSTRMDNGMHNSFIRVGFHNSNQLFVSKDSRNIAVTNACGRNESGLEQRRCLYHRLFFRHLAIV